MCSIEDFNGEDDNGVHHQNIRNRCGEIFFEEDKLKYYCLFCQKDFGLISTFISHLYKSHLFMDPPLFEDEKSQLDINDCSKIDCDDIKYDTNKSYLIGHLDENNDAFCILENNDHQKFVPNLDIEDDSDRSNSHFKIENDLCEINEGDNLLNKYKLEIIENETYVDGHIDIIQNQCKICLKILSSERSLKRHLLTHQNLNNARSDLINKYNFPKGNDDKFHCNLCSSTYSRLDSLRRHIKRHWGSTNHAKCSVCSKILSSKVHLKAHMRVHTGERPHKCDHCPAAFADRTNFDRHLRIHLGDKRYNCDYCDKTFIQRSEKKIHERMVHTKERPFQCEICGRKFFNGVSLNDHQKRHTNTRPCECEICGKRFYNKKLLKDHKISHSNEKPYACDICYARFARRKALRQHLKIHSSVKEYVCTICNKAFAQNAGLYSHMKSHTGNPQTTNNVTSNPQTSDNL